MALTGLPIILGGLSALGSIVGTYLVRLGSGTVMRALYRGVLIAAGISAILFVPAILAMGDTLDGLGSHNVTADNVTAPRLLICAFAGLIITALLMAITEYYTGTRWKPVRDIADASHDGARDQHHLGPRLLDAGDRGAGDRDRRRDPRGQQALRHLSGSRSPSSRCCRWRA